MFQILDIIKKLDWKGYVHDKRIPKISREDHFLFFDKDFFKAAKRIFVNFLSAKMGKSSDFVKLSKF